MKLITRTSISATEIIPLTTYGCEAGASIYIDGGTPTAVGLVDKTDTASGLPITLTGGKGSFSYPAEAVYITGAVGATVKILQHG